MRLFIISSIFGVVILASSLCYAADKKESAEEIQDIPRIYLTYGPGGPKRKAIFFAGEVIYIKLELPKNFSFDDKLDLLCDLSLISQVKKARDVSNSKPIPLQGFSSRESSSFFYLFLAVPPDFEEGEYDLCISVQNKKNSVLYEGKVVVNLYSSSCYGIRNLMFMHGVPKTTYWVPGSNIFAAGETAKISFAVGGLSLNANAEVEALVKLTLVDQEGMSVNILDLGPTPPMLKHRISASEHSKTWTFSHEFILTQPGDFVLKVGVEDLNSLKKDSCELPLHVFSFEYEGLNGKIEPKSDEKPDESLDKDEMK